MSHHDVATAAAPSPLMTQREVAAFFKCEPRTIRNWTRRELLKPIRIGRRTFYCRTEVEKFAGFE